MNREIKLFIYITFIVSFYSFLWYEIGSYWGYRQGIDDCIKVIKLKSND